MLRDIRAKLVPELLEPITSERQVVYILCEIRKLADADKQRWKTLKLYCDWVVHVDLDYKTTTGPFLQEVDKLFEFLESPTTATGISPEQNAVIEKLVYLDQFRDELRTFLNEQKQQQPDISTELTDDDGRWNSFLLHYGGVIEDGSLIYKVDGLKAIRKMTFTKLPPSSHIMPFDIKWEIETKSGYVYSFMLRPGWKLPGALLVRKPG